MTPTPTSRRPKVKHYDFCAMLAITFGLLGIVCVAAGCTMSWFAYRAEEDANLDLDIWWLPAVGGLSYALVLWWMAAVVYLLVEIASKRSNGT